MTSSSSILPEQSIETDPLPAVIQDMILDYVAGDFGDFAESKSIYTAENRCTIFESGPKNMSHNKLVFHYSLSPYVVRGEQNEVQAILNVYPELIFKSGRVKDLSGNTFVDFCPVELARFAHDVEMLEMMKPYADKVKGGTEKFIAILKNASEYEEAKKQEIYDFSGIIAAITGNNEEIVTYELNRFRQAFGPRTIENSEKSYNIKILQKAYEDCAGLYNGWLVDRRNLFWCQVIGFLQRSLPACYAQAFCQGLDSVTKGGKPLKRGLELCGGEGNFYPSDLSLSRGLGFDFGIFFRRPSSACEDAAFASWCGRTVAIYAKQKQQRCESLCDTQAVKPSVVYAG